MDINDAVEEMAEFGRKAQQLKLDNVGNFLVESVKKNIDEGGRPEKFKPRIKTDDPWPLLRKTDTMYDSIKYDIKGDEVTVYPDTDYAVYVDAERPFMDVVDEDLDRIENDLLDSLGME